MLNYIWLALILVAVFMAGSNGQIPEMTKKAFDMCNDAVMTIGLPLVGVMALWLGIMRLAEKSGMVQILARLLRPIMVWLFPDVPADHPAMGSMLLNMAANMLGLGNAAAPLGIRAMEHLETLNPRPGTATNAMCTFLAINTSSIQLIPVTAVGVLAVNGSKNPSAIIGPAIAATGIAFIAAIIAVKSLEKLPMFRLPPVTPGETQEKKTEIKREKETEGETPKIDPLKWWGVLALVIFFLFFVGVLVLWLGYPDTQDFVNAIGLRDFFKALPFDTGDRMWIRAMKCVSALSIPLLLSFFPLYAFLRGIKVYEEFVEGAKEGFQIIIRIIPNLVAILVAIAMFRASGGIDVLTDGLKSTLSAVHFPPELLPMAMIRPLSGSGSFGVFIELVKKYGPDHLFSRTAGTIYGSTETTFYVLAVYFGAVNIKRARHAVPAGLVADVVAIIASVVICKQVFG